MPGLALWNGRDPILKERMFGLTGAEANHGEDVKDYWWYLDASPSHAWNRWRYHYPQRAFPYEDLVAENGGAASSTRVRAPRHWRVRRGSLLDLRGRLRQGRGRRSADDRPGDQRRARRRHAARPADGVVPQHLVVGAGCRQAGPTWRTGGWIEIDHPFIGELELLAGAGPGGIEPVALFCDNETNSRRLFGDGNGSRYPKDAINDHVVGGHDTVNPQQTGTKAAFWYEVPIEPGATVELRLRMRPRGSKPSKASSALGRDFDKVVDKRRRETDEFYAELTPAGVSADEALVMRQAFAGMLWGKQFFEYDVSRWLDGDPTQPVPPVSRLTGRNSRWRHFESYDIMSMPDKWEYPWFAAWDLAFHCVALAHVDAAFAKYQLLLICREWFQHPNGALPAYEWDFGDVNPPVQAWATLEVFAIDGGRDLDFLSKIFDKLLVNFTWWINRQDADGSNLFEGGFLGLDNIGPLDRSHLPVGGVLKQSDATGWMAFYALSMGAIASILNRTGQRPATDLVLKFLEHFAAMSDAMERLNVWDETDGLYYDKLVTPDGTEVHVKVRSMVGIIPLLAAIVVDEHAIARSRAVGKQFSRLIGTRGLGNAQELGERGLLRGEPGDRRLLLGVVGIDRLQRLFEKLFDEDEFLSPYGLRALSAYHREHPYVLSVEGITAEIDYEPAESTTAMFGGNSNWRGPVWFPLNALVITALERYHRFFGDDFQVEYPTRSGTMLSLDKIADDLRARLVALFLAGPDGRRPSFGGVERLQTDPAWKANIVFNEYFHGDNGAGLARRTRRAGPASSPTSSAAAPATACSPSANSPTSCGTGSSRVHRHGQLRDEAQGPPSRAEGRDSSANGTRAPRSSPGRAASVHG